MESRQLGGDLHGDVGVGELLCAHARVLEKKAQAETTSSWAEEARLGLAADTR